MRASSYLTPLNFVSDEIFPVLFPFLDDGIDTLARRAAAAEIAEMILKLVSRGVDDCFKSRHGFDRRKRNGE